MVSRRKLIGLTIPMSIVPLTAFTKGKLSNEQVEIAIYRDINSLVLSHGKNGDIAYVHSYHEGMNSGGGWFYHCEDHLTEVNMITIFPSVNGQWIRSFEKSNIIDCSQAGMQASTDFDNTERHQRLMNFADDEGLDIHYGSGVYYHSGIVEKKQSFSCPSLKGCGGRHSNKGTIFSFAEGAFLKIKGGSGYICGSTVSCISFKGSGENNGLLVLADQCGITIKNCLFDKCLTGVRVINESANAFSEFNVLSFCVFSSTCLTGFSYERLKGKESFHGTGLLECIFQEKNNKKNNLESNLSAHIKIGKGCRVYSAPMTIHVFRYTSGLPIVQHDGLPTSNVYGVITIEKSPNNVVEMVSGKKLYIIGSVISLSENLVTKNAIFCTRFQANSDGSVNYIRSQTSLSGDLKESNHANIMTFLPGESSFIDVSLITHSGIERRLLYVSFDENGNGSLNSLSHEHSEVGSLIDEIVHINKLSLLINDNTESVLKWIMNFSFLSSRYQYSMR